MTAPTREDIRRFFAEKHVDLSPLLVGASEPYAAIAAVAFRLPQPKAEAFELWDHPAPDLPLSGDDLAMFWSGVVRAAIERGLSIWHLRKFLLPEILADDPAERRNRIVGDLEAAIAALTTDVAGSANPWRPVRDIEVETSALEELRAMLPRLQALRRPQSRPRSNNGTRNEDVFRNAFVDGLREQWIIYAGRPRFTAEKDDSAGPMDFLAFADCAYHDVCGFSRVGNFRRQIEKVAGRLGWTRPFEAS